MPLSQQIGSSLWALGVGTGFIIIIYTLISGGWFREAGHRAVRSADPLPEAADERREYPGGFVIEEGHGPVPIVIKILTVSFLVFLVYYVAQYLGDMNGTLGTLDLFLTK